MASTGAGWNRDALVGILGAAILVAAMAGVFLYERGQFQEYAVQWEMQEAGASDPMSGNLDQGDSGPHSVTLSAEDLPEGRALAQVRATVEWTDDVGDPDTFSVAVQGPGDLGTDPVDGDSSPVTAEAGVHAEPEMTTASGRTAEDAADQAAATLGAERGLGEWTVEVTLEDAPGDPGGPGGVNSQPDGSNSYTLTVAWDVWEPVVTS